MSKHDVGLDEMRYLRLQKIHLFSVSSLLTCFLWGIVLGVGLTSGCRRGEDRCRAEKIQNWGVLKDRLEEWRPEYKMAIGRARSWVDRLTIDPRALRAEKILGIKKLTEQVGFYYRLWTLADTSERKRLEKQVEKVVRPARLPEFHDLSRVSDELFKQESLSYLRLAVLLKKMGIAYSLYDQEIGQIKGRIDKHLIDRGPHQKQTFHNYYRSLGLKEPFPLGESVSAGLISDQRPLSELKRREFYELTHELFSLFDFGDDLSVQPFSFQARRYLARTLPRLVLKNLSPRRLDILAELTSCLRMARLVGEREYLLALEFLLDNQNLEGSWGRYEVERRRYGGKVQSLLRLHTTLVTVDALAFAFHPPRNQNLEPEQMGCEE